MSSVTNIAAYKFASLTELKSLREQLTRFCKKRTLKGTILLSPEGINLFVAGEAAGIDELVAFLHYVPGLEDLTPKASASGHQPFTRMLVRIKKEIIAFGVDGIEPARRTSPKLPAATLKQWLDEGRPLTLLDTRNDYEVKLGTFKGALALGIDHFREFPKAVDALPKSMKKQPIVMFCTGGIRCEKAGPFMEREGFENVYQLDGGILKYFEECGGDHYDGECFVFDQRVGVDPALRESESALCFVCQAPLTPMNQRDARYRPGESCPYCFRSPVEAREDILTRRRAHLVAIAHPLPGSTPCGNRKPVRIPQNFDRCTLLEFLTTAFPHHSADRWRAACEEGRFLDAQETVAGADRLVRVGERYFHLMPGNIEPPVDAEIGLIYEDDALVIVNKPAPLPVHPSGRFNRNTLQHFLSVVYAPERPRPAHRLDANTTGVIVCARTRHFARLLQPQFEAGTVEKTYLARVTGHPATDEFSCARPISATPGLLGTRQTDDSDAGLPALTHFRVLHRAPNGTTLVEVHPKTGRTNQIRVHLWSLGIPVAGDPAYLPDGKVGTAMTRDPESPPMCLHARDIRFRHPVRGEDVSFSATVPSWAETAAVSGV
jgi:RluA family pseudouridine synthase